MATLTNPNPVITEPIPAKEFPHLWLYNVHVHSPSITSGMVNIETIPYNSDTQELGSGENMVRISTDDLWGAVNEVPEVATAMLAIFNAVEPLRNWIAAKSSNI